MILPPTQLIKGLAEMLEEWNCSEPNLEEMSLERLWELESAAEHLKEEAAKFATTIDELRWKKNSEPFTPKPAAVVTESIVTEAISAQPSEWRPAKPDESGWNKPMDAGPMTALHGETYEEWKKRTGQ